jgi:hypothetical protein
MIESFKQQELDKPVEVFNSRFESADYRRLCDNGKIDIATTTGYGW